MKVIKQLPNGEVVCEIIKKTYAGNAAAKHVMRVKLPVNGPAIFFSTI